MMENNKWREIALSRISGQKIELKKAEGLWIVPRKLTLEAMEMVTKNSHIDEIPESELEGKTDEEKKIVIQTKIQERLDNNVKTRTKILDDETRSIVKAVVLGGVAEHNFEVEWNANFFDDIINSFFELAMEIFTEVMNFNRPLEKVTSEKFEMSQNGSSKE